MRDKRLMLGLTYFSSRRDNRPDGKTLSYSSWEEFVKYLKHLSNYEGLKPGRDEEEAPNHSPLISPAFFKKGEKRRKDAVIGWAGWAALDIDDYKGDIDDFDNRGFQCVLYSTASSRKESPAFRVVVPLRSWIKGEDIPDFWYALNMHYLEIADPQAKDTCRMYYVPAKYPGAYNFFQERGGEMVCPRDLTERYPVPRLQKRRMYDRVTLDLQKAIREERHQLLLERGVNLNWTTYHECPFVNKKMIEAYKGNSSKGYYHRFYSIMVSIASRATKMGYDIDAGEIEELMREIDHETGSWYSTRSLRREAENAIQFARQSS